MFSAKDGAASITLELAEMNQRRNTYGNDYSVSD